MLRRWKGTIFTREAFWGRCRKWQEEFQFFALLFVVLFKWQFVSINGYFAAVSYLCLSMLQGCLCFFQSKIIDFSEAFVPATN